MRLFDWLFGPSWDDRYKTFLTNLTKENKPQLVSSWSLNIFAFHLYFDEVRITVEYNTTRKTWSIRTWCPAAEELLFYYDILDTPPHKAIKFIREKYNLDNLLQKELNKRAAEAIRKENIKRKILNKYIG